MIFKKCIKEQVKDMRRQNKLANKQQARRLAKQEIDGQTKKTVKKLHDTEIKNAMNEYYEITPTEEMIFSLGKVSGY